MAGRQDGGRGGREYGRQCWAVACLREQCWAAAVARAHTRGSRCAGRYSAQVESEIMDLKSAGDMDGVRKYEEEEAASKMEKIITSGYHTLQLIHFYTAGPD